MESAKKISALPFIAIAIVSLSIGGLIWFKNKKAKQSKPDASGTANGGLVTLEASVDNQGTPIYTLKVDGVVGRTGYASQEGTLVTPDGWSIDVVKVSGGGKDYAYITATRGAQVLKSGNITITPAPLNDGGQQLFSNAQGMPFTGIGTLDDPIDYHEPASQTPYGRSIKIIAEDDPEYNASVPMLPYHQYVPNGEPLLDKIENLFDSGPTQQSSLSRISHGVKIDMNTSRMNSDGGNKDEHSGAWYNHG